MEILIKILLLMVTIATRFNSIVSYPCRSNWIKYKERCFLFPVLPETLSSARLTCRQNGGYLAEVKNSQSMAELNNAFNISALQIWTNVQFIKNKSNDVFFVLEDATRHVTDCPNCDQLALAFQTSSLTSSCVKIAKGSDWLLEKCDSLNQYICESNPVPRFDKLQDKKGFGDYVAIACGSFLFISFVLIVLVGAFCKSKKLSNLDTTLSSEEAPSSLVN